MPEHEHVTNKPELSIGPFAGGIGVAVWRNEIETAQGQRTVRSITIAARRYRDKESGEWKDTYSYRPIDLTALILALEKAQEHILSHPIRGNDFDDEQGDGQTPF
jgi:hypothetical protein